jgi:flavin reductase (DIM6/NTAB) family NADH-FMN oxidoreductase RutF
LPNAENRFSKEKYFTACDSLIITGNGDDFMQKNAFHTLSYGVYAVTTMDGERPVGCIANSAMQITSQPPTLAISINQQNYTHDIIQKTGKLAVCVLPEQTDLSVIGTFGFQSSREVEKFAEIAYDQKDGLPVLKQCCAWFTLEVVQQMNAGTHTVFLAKVLDCDCTTAQQPMTYAYYHNVLKMKSPKAAPTYVEE